MSDKISPKTPDIASDIETPWGEIGYVVYKRTYSRRLKEDDLGGQTEEYIDTVNRIIRACRKQLDVGFTPEEEAEVAEILLSLKGTVAGRFFWQLGTKTVDKLGLLSLQNCAACVVDDPVRPFLWTFDALMLGCGVGYNLQRENVYKLPKVKKKKIKIERLDVKDADFIVPDSREGWVKLLGRVLKAYFYSGEGFTYSTLLIRGKGTAIKGFGGIASGPEDLVSGIASICNVLDSRRGKQLRPIDCLDIMNIIGSIVVSGNVRRSAAISIGDYDDLDFLNAKNWGEGNIPNWRAMSNNSVVCNDIAKLPPQFWDTYHGNSEPYGLINLRLSREIGRTGETQYPDPEVQAYNPCVVGETEILTRDGYVRIDSVVDQPVEVWNGFEWSQVAPKITGHNQRLLTIKFSDGRELTCTRYHKFHLNNGLVVEAQKLKIDDALIEHTYPTLIEQINNARKVYLPWGEVSLEKDSELRWPVDELKKAQAILSTMGVQSHFDGHVLSVKKRDNAPHGVHVVSIADAGVANTVYCFNEPKRHLGIFNGVITGQCAEQSLAPYETCCLAEVHLPNITSKEELLKVAKYLYRINKHSLLLPCHHPETEAIVHKNMRMGIGITGYLMATDEQQSWLSDTYLALRAYDAEYSKQHGFPPSIKITTVKPSGTLSLLSGVTSGAHPGYSHYFIRRVRMASNIPLVDVCRNKGYHVEYERNFDNTENRNTVVVSFPCSLPEHTKLAKDMSAIDQLEVVAKLQREWSDNAVSVTVYYRKEELSLIQGWLLENFNDRIKSVSFLLHSDHGFQQAPLEEITKEQYEEMSSKVDQITSLASIEESSVSSDGLGCETGACPLK